MGNSFEQAHDLAWEFYRQHQQSKAVPAWIVVNSTGSAKKNRGSIWIVTRTMYKRQIISELPLGLSWERRKDGSNELVSRDLETGERRGLVSYDVEDSKMLNLFEAEVDVASGVVTMKQAVAVDVLRPEDFMLEFDNFDLTKIWQFDQSVEQNRRNILGHR